MQSSGAGQMNITMKKDKNSVKSRQNLKIKIVPSILSANFNFLQKEVDKVSNADYLQFDVMDGHFVNNISFGAVVMQKLKTNLKKDVHLMIYNPENYVEQFAKAGADIITFHIEATRKPKMIIGMIKKHRVKAGIAINPATPIARIKKFLPYLDQVIIMTVNPGWEGQSFIESCLGKIRELRKIYSGDIMVDGGINDRTIVDCAKAGANLFVAGSFVFHSKHPRKTVELLRKKAKGNKYK